MSEDDVFTIKTGSSDEKVTKDTDLSMDLIEVKEESIRIVEDLVETLPEDITNLQAIQLVDNTRRIFMTASRLIKKLIEDKIEFITKLNEDSTMH